MKSNSNRLKKMIVFLHSLFGPQAGVNKKSKKIRTICLFQQCATPISVCQMRKSLKLSVRIEIQSGRVLPNKGLFIHPWTNEPGLGQIYIHLLDFRLLKQTKDCHQCPADRIYPQRHSLPGTCLSECLRFSAPLAPSRPLGETAKMTYFGPFGGYQNGTSGARPDQNSKSTFLQKLA